MPALPFLGASALHVVSSHDITQIFAVFYTACSCTTARLAVRLETLADKHLVDQGALYC